MKKRLIPAALALLTAGAANPQSAPPAPSQVYASSLYLRVTAEKQAAFVEFYKSGLGAKAARGRLAADPNLTSVSLRQAAYAGVNAPPANFVLVSVTNGAPAELDPAKRDEVYRKATGVSYADYIAKARELSTVTGSTLSHVHERTPDYQSAEGDYIVMSRIKVNPTRSQDLNEVNRTMRLPLNTQRVKDGALKGWSFSHLVFPAGNSLPWTATETTLHKDLANAVGGPGTGAGGGGGGGGGGAMGLGGGGGANAAYFAKVLPNANYTQFLDVVRDGRTVVRRDLYRVVAAYHK